MSIDAITLASKAGLTYERMRMDAASRNIAASNVPLTNGASAQRTEALQPAGFEQAMLQVGLQQVPARERTVHDPGHPLADANGMVRYSEIDLVQEMTTLMTASRGYEANVRAYNMLRGMFAQAVQIGAK
jgi:flagellar basal-body rod protein FlgC